MIEGKNFTDQQTPPFVDTHYSRCNFSQSQPVLDGSEYKGVRLFPGDDTPRLFEDCNLVNAEPPPGSTVLRCNTAVIERGFLISSEDVIVDGVVIDTIETRGMRVHGRFVSGAYEYKPEAEIIAE